MVASHPSTGNQCGLGAQQSLFTDEILELVVNSLPTLSAGGSALIWLPLFKKFVYIQLFIFGCAGSSLLPGFLSSCGEWGLLFLAMWILLLQSMDPRVHGFGRRSSRALQHKQTVVVCRLSCSVAGGIFPDQGWKPCLLHWLSGSLPQSLPGKPLAHFVNEKTGPQK